MFLVLVGLAVAYFGCILGLFICAALHSQWPLVQAGCYLSWVAADFAQFFLHLGVFFVIVGIAVAHFWLHSCSVHVRLCIRSCRWFSVDVTCRELLLSLLSFLHL